MGSMKSRPSLCVFEHQILSVGERGFDQTHFDKIILYNEVFGNKFIIPGYKKIKFTNYVGVIQVGDLTIEVLPKADKADNHEKWRQALMLMLIQCKKVQVKSISEAQLKLRSSTLLDIILEGFLTEIEYLIAIGLVKGYRKIDSNKTSLKGRILFNQHLAKNLTHRELFFTRSEVYDYNIVWNQILKLALQIIVTTVRNNVLRIRANKLLWYFDDIDQPNFVPKVFSNLRYNRKTESYRKAIGLAELIILSFSPDVKSGLKNVLAVLFDMNSLFEEYVYMLFKKEEKSFSHVNLSIEPQSSKSFWSNRKIRPDMVLRYDHPERMRIIIDTKWKILEDYHPSDDDLKQMYAYNLHFNASRSVLLYPKINQIYQPPVEFHPSESVVKDHSCQLAFIDLFNNEGMANKGVAKRMLNLFIEPSHRI